MSGGGTLPLHRPVLYAQVLEGLRIVEDGTYLDGTFGRGGHARGVLSRLGPKGRLLVMDKDPQAIEVALRLAVDDARVSVRHGSFAALKTWPDTALGLDGVLFDLGVSSPQLEAAERGFSFGQDGPLDMRMDPSSGISLADWLASADVAAIADVLWRYGEERCNRRIARSIVARRAQVPIRTTGQLVEAILAAGVRAEPGKHPATRSFQALRIYINRELDDLESGLAAAHDRLKPGGRMAVISFHSLEDRIVKRFIAVHAKPAPGNRRLPAIAERKLSLREVGAPLRAQAPELADNPRARSAVLRIAERCA